MDFWQGLWLVVTNFPALLVAAKWYYWGHGLVPLIFISVFVNSSSYHACDSWSGFCMYSDYQVLHDLDFWSAQMTITVAALHLIYWVSPHPDVAIPLGVPFLQSAFIFFFGFLNALVIILANSHELAQLATVGLALLTVVFYWIGYGIRYKSFPKYNIPHLLLGLTLTGISLLLFNFQNAVPEMYWGIHGAWHCTGFCGAWYWASVMPMFPSWLNVGEEVGAFPQTITSRIDINKIWEYNTKSLPGPSSTIIDAISVSKPFVRRRNIMNA